MNKEVSANSTARMVGKKPAAGALILPKGSFIDSIKAPKASMKNKMLVTIASFFIGSLAAGLTVVRSLQSSPLQTISYFLEPKTSLLHRGRDFLSIHLPCRFWWRPLYLGWFP